MILLIPYIKIIKLKNKIFLIIFNNSKKYLKLNIFFLSLLILFSQIFNFELLIFIFWNKMPSLIFFDSLSYINNLKQLHIKIK